MPLKTFCQKVLRLLLLGMFVCANPVIPTSFSYTQELFTLPAPGTRIDLSPAFEPPLLKGIKVYTNNPFRLDFMIDRGEKVLSAAELKEESARMAKYFLASLTIPEGDLWVNLSPYEKDRIIPEGFGVTQMGRDLLAQDYLLKQITASVIYPETAMGKEFWGKVYAQAQEKYGRTDAPVNTFNKVWIVPEKATVYENPSPKAGEAMAFVVESRLKVMLEEDYLALNKNGTTTSSAAASQVVRDIVLPQLTKEINTGKNFAQLRQVYHSLILATWFKNKIKDSILSSAYVGRDKTGGIDVNRSDKDKIYAGYLEAFKKGAFNYVKEEYSAEHQKIMPRKYFSGGVELGRAMRQVYNVTARRSGPRVNPSRAMIAQIDLVSEQPARPKVNYAITGGTGTISNQLIRHLLAKEDTGNIYILVRNLDDNAKQKIFYKDFRVKPIVGDLRDAKALDQLVDQSDVIYHLGGPSGKGNLSFEDARDEMIVPTQRLLEKAEQGDKRLIFSSTVMVYGLGSAGGGRFTEQDLILSREMKDKIKDLKHLEALKEGVQDFYTFAKLYTEREVQKSNNGMVLRFGNVYGPGDDKTGRTVTKAIREKTVGTYAPGREIGFIYIDDLVEALYRAGKLEEVNKETNQTINITSPQNISHEEVMQTIGKVVAPDTEIKSAQSTGIVHANFKYDVTRMREILGMETLTPFEEGIKATIAWHQSTEEEKWAGPSQENRINEAIKSLEGVKLDLPEIGEVDVSRELANRNMTSLPTRFSDLQLIRWLTEQAARSFAQRRIEDEGGQWNKEREKEADDFLQKRMSWVLGEMVTKGVLDFEESVKELWDERAAMDREASKGTKKVFEYLPESIAVRKVGHWWLRLIQGRKSYDNERMEKAKITSAESMATPAPYNPKKNFNYFLEDEGPLRRLLDFNIDGMHIAIDVNKLPQSRHHFIFIPKPNDNLPQTFDQVAIDAMFALRKLSKSGRLSLGFNTGPLASVPHKHGQGKFFEKTMAVELAEKTNVRTIKEVEISQTKDFPAEIITLKLQDSPKFRADMVEFTDYLRNSGIIFSNSIFKDEFRVWLEDLKIGEYEIMKFGPASGEMLGEPFVEDPELFKNATDEELEGRIVRDYKKANRDKATYDQAYHKLQEILASPAMITNQAAIAKDGGIDLNNLKVGMQNSSGNEQMTIDPAMMARLKHEGIKQLTPVILNISPLEPASTWLD